MPIIINSDLIIINRVDSASYDDFTPYWYQQKGVSLILGAYARIFVPVWEIFFRYSWPRLYQWWDRKFKSDKGITRQRTTENYLEVYKNENFDIERSYAEVMNTIFFTCFYFGGLPHIVIPGIINLVMIYYKDKILSNYFS